MCLHKLFDKSVLVSSPPPGAVNVRTGNPVKGLGGRWIPCASATADGVYVPCVYEVGPGRRQVCMPFAQSSSVEEALSWAAELASTAAA